MALNCIQTARSGKLRRVFTDRMANQERALINLVTLNSGEISGGSPVIAFIKLPDMPTFVTRDTAEAMINLTNAVGDQVSKCTNSVERAITNCSAAISKDVKSCTQSIINTTLFVFFLGIIATVLILRSAFKYFEM